MKWIKKHYHWVVAIALFIVTAFRGGLINNQSLHLLPFTEALNISRTQFSLAVSASNVTTMLMAMFSGVLILRLYLCCFLCGVAAPAG